MKNRFLSSTDLSMIVMSLLSAVIFDHESVLLARRNQEPAKGLWSLPGGMVELGEAHIKALVRELREELSVTIGVGGLVGVFDRIFRDPKGLIQYHYVVVDYWGWITEGHPTPASDVSEALFVPLNELEKFDVDRDLIEIIRKAESAWREAMLKKPATP